MAIVKFEFITNSCKQLRQKMNDWRHKFTETALGALKTYFDDQDSPRPVCVMRR
jgi:hypothetical protein